MTICSCGCSELVVRYTTSSRMIEVGKEARACSNCLVPKCMTCSNSISSERVFCSHLCRSKFYWKKKETSKVSIVEDCSCGCTVDNLVVRYTISKKAREAGKEARACPRCLAPKCMTCSKPITENRVFCSYSCKQKFFSKGEKNNFYRRRLFGEENSYYGRKHSDETRQKMSVAQTPERRKAAAELLRDMWDDPKFRVKVQASPTTTPKWHASSKSGDTYYRSSYELKAYQILDNDESVKSYCTERVPIEYVCSGKNKRYFPDILVEYIDGSFGLIEVKSKYNLLKTDTQLKVLAGIKWSLENDIPYSVWTEPELGLYNRYRMTT